MSDLDNGYGIAVASPVGPVSMRMSRTGLEPQHCAPHVEPLGTGGRTYVWTPPGLVARLSIFPFDAALDLDVWVRPVTCWAFLWHIEALHPSPVITLTMSFEDPATDAGPDCGQAFIAVAVSTDAWEVIIGGPDEEQLAADAAAGLLPAHWQPEFEIGAVNPTAAALAMILPGNRGLRWVLPAMHAEDRCLFGANLCWSPHRSLAQADDASTWYAALTTTAGHLQHRASFPGQ